MIVHLYAVCWNEADILPFFFRHYDPWVDRYVFFDDGSTDETLAVLAAHPRVEVRRFPRTDPKSFVYSHRELQNNIWKESRGTADWTVITAVDEHLHHPLMPMSRYLKRCRSQGITYIPALGYQMLSQDFPSPTEWLCRTRTRGAPFDQMNKLSIFNPDAIAETGFHVGRHAAEPKGSLRHPERDEILLLHYKYLGFEKAFARQQFLQTGLREVDLQKGFGNQYFWAREKYQASWDEFASRAIDVSRRSIKHHATHPVPRWWRGPEAVALLRAANLLEPSPVAATSAIEAA